MKTIVCDMLIVMGEYEVEYALGINPDIPDKPQDMRFPGIYLGFIPSKSYDDTPRCICCHRKTVDGTYAFHNPLNGGVYRFCSKCMSMGVSHRRLNMHCTDIMTEYWRYEDVDDKKEFIKYTAGAFVDLLRWLEIEPDLANEIQRKLVDKQ